MPPSDRNATTIAPTVDLDSSDSYAQGVPHEFLGGLEAAITFDELRPHLEQFSLDDDVQPLRSSYLAGIKHVRTLR